MLEKIKKLEHNPYLSQLRDIRIVGFLVFGCIVLLVSYSGVKVIQTNYELEKQVSKLEQEIAVAELRNNNVRFQNEYYKSSEYLELMARKQYNKGLAGETLLLVPKTVAMKYAVPSATPAAETPAKKPVKPLYQRNFEAWRDFFIHRSAVK